MKQNCQCNYCSSRPHSKEQDLTVVACNYSLGQYLYSKHPKVNVYRLQSDSFIQFDFKIVISQYNAIIFYFNKHIILDYDTKDMNKINKFIKLIYWVLV